MNIKAVLSDVVRAGSAVAAVLVIVLNAGGLVNPEFYALRDVTAILR